MPVRVTDHQREAILRALNVIVVLCGATALAILVAVIGWPLDEQERSVARFATRCVLAVFVAQELLRFILQENRRRYLRGRYLEAVLALAAGAELLLGEPLLSWLQTRDTDRPASVLTLFYLAGTQLTLVLLIFVRSLRRNRLLSARSLTPGMVFILSFAVLVAAGTLLLKTPQATTAGISWIDALFTATSAVCVTGLTTVDTASAFTPHGKWILLALIQTGGLGVMTITYFFAYFVAGGVSLRNRVALQDMLSEENLGHVGTVLGIIVGFTLIIELAGAFVLYTLLGAQPVTGIDDPFFFSLFHAVSAFCNAGFSTLSPNLADPSLHNRHGIFSVIMVLIVLGGIGFPVVKNLAVVSVARVRRLCGANMIATERLTAGSRLALITTAMLLVGGTGLIWLTEFVFGHGQANGASWFTALFHAVTARTAGFNITPVDALLPATAAIMMFLMFVGGSPSSTAGGIKTSTLAVAVLAVRRVLTGRSDMEAFGRRFSADTGDRALAIILLAVGFITLVTIALCALHPELSPADLTFEAVSAVGTVGLTRGVTPLLGAPAKLVIVAAMFVGRIGVLLFFLSFISRRSSAGYRFPETTVPLT